jgi:hypothetical protein
MTVRSLLSALLVGPVLLGGTVLAEPVRVELSAAAGLDGAYDSNVYNGRGPDYVNRVTPRGSFRLIGPRLTFNVQYDAGIWTYALGKARNSINHHAGASIEGKISRRLNIKIADEFVRAQDPGFLARTGVVAPQIGIFDNIVDLALDYGFTRRLYGALAYTWHRTTFDPFDAAEVGLAPLFDGSEHDINAAFVYRATRLGYLRVTGRFQLFTAGPQDESAERWTIGASYSPTLGWTQHLRRDLDLGADFGPIFYQALPEADNVPNATGSGVTFRGSARLRYHPRNWIATLGYSRDLLGATGAGTAIWADYVYGQVGFHWHQRLESIAGIGYFRNGSAVNEPTSYDGINLSAGIDYRALDYFRIGAYYTLRWQQTGPGAIPIGANAAQFPNVIRNVVGIRLLAVVGADARPPRREVHE